FAPLRLIAMGVLAGEATTIGAAWLVDCCAGAPTCEGWWCVAGRSRMPTATAAPTRGIAATTHGQRFGGLAWRPRGAAWRGTTGVGGCGATACRGALCAAATATGRR